MAIEGLIAQYGLIGIFLAAGTEGEAAAVAGGLIAHRHLIPLWQVGLAIYGGSLLAGQILFLVARRFRDAPWIRKQTSRPAYAKVARLLETRPTGFILVYRFVFGVRMLTPIVLGATRISTARFSVLNAVGALIWSVVFTGLGYGFGKTAERLFGRMASGNHLMLIGGAVVVMLIIAFLISRRRSAFRDGG